MRACCLLVLLVACGKSDKPPPARVGDAAPSHPADAAPPPVDAAPAPGAKLTVRMQEMAAYAAETAVVGDALWMPGKTTMIILSTKGGVACPPDKPKEYGPDDFMLALELEGAPALGTHAARNEWRTTSASGGMADVTVTLTALDPLAGTVRAVAPDHSVSFVGEFVARRCDIAPE
jgi:hypothetical protein